MLEFVMNPLNNVVHNLVVLVILATFLEMLLPENDMRKYARLIFGLMILATILHPVALLLNHMERLPNDGYQYSYIEIEDEQFDENTVNRVLDQYKENIALQTKSIIEPYADGYEIEIKVEVIEDYSDEKFGEISSIYVMLNKENMDKIAAVKPVVIGEEPEKKLVEDFEGKEEIVGAISSYYHISGSKISVAKVEENN
ncbi:stage III sporulation protein AF [Proteinivorax tanatarense]|uniref:Stage III sporulation protein AF n=1 Tax=Proteinivorax tanatarense TaxID=1260629 RepID=A0AAU7VPD5_9FIRM